MPIAFECPSCHEEVRVSRRHAGKRGKCPSCFKEVVVPASTGHDAEDKEALERHAEALIAARALEAGSVAKKALKEARTELDALRLGGAGVCLGNVLVRRGALDAKEAAAVQARYQKRFTVCSACF